MQYNFLYFKFNISKDNLSIPLLFASFSVAFSFCAEEKSGSSLFMVPQTIPYEKTTLLSVSRITISLQDVLRKTI